MCRQNKEHSDNDEKLLQQREHDETDVTPEELEKYVKVDIHMIKQKSSGITGALRIFLKDYFNYASAIALTGHCPAHEPQSMHVASSITNFPSPALIAPTGHCPSQEPQLMQESPIQYAIIIILLKL